MAEYIHCMGSPTRMKCSSFFGLAILAFGTAAALFSLRAEDGIEERELVQDRHFQRGFILWKPEPGKHVRYGEVRGFDLGAAPIWGLSQWSSKFPLDPAALARPAIDLLVCSNAAKSVFLGQSGTSKADLAMALNASIEYGATARKAGDPWVHLLVEQEFDAPPPLEKLSAAILRVEARLLRSRNLHEQDYSPDVHAAQFQIFFTVQNRNRQSPGYGDLLWFGVPIYDNRERFPKEFKAQDFGGTAKFIFTPEGKAFSAASAHDGEWVTIKKDLLPLMGEALEAAWAKGFLGGSKTFGDYHIGGMNMGWELPGTFDVKMQVRNLSLKVVSGGVGRELGFQ
jgi:hypothetical protein